MFTSTVFTILREFTSTTKKCPLHPTYAVRPSTEKVEHAALDLLAWKIICVQLNDQGLLDVVRVTWFKICMANSFLGSFCYHEIFKDNSRSQNAIFSRTSQYRVLGVRPLL